MWLPFQLLDMSIIF